MMANIEILLNSCEHTSDGRYVVTVLNQQYYDPKTGSLKLPEPYVPKLT